MTADYDSADTAILRGLAPSRLVRLLHAPASSWDTEQWQYAVLAADDSAEIRGQILGKLTEEFRSAKGTVMAYWEAIDTLKISADSLPDNDLSQN